MKNGFQGVLHTSGRGSLFAATCLLPLMMGCPPQGEAYREMGTQDDVTNTEAGHHHDAGPHGGHIVELGDYHGEILVDDGHVLTLYILGGDAVTPVPLKNATAKVHAHLGDKEQEIPLTAKPQDGETDGASSRYTSAADALPAEVVDIEGIGGEVILVVDGKETTGPITHDHDHDHDHAEKHADDHDHDQKAKASTAPVDKKAEPAAEKK